MGIKGKTMAAAAVPGIAGICAAAYAVTAMQADSADPNMVLAVSGAIVLAGFLVGALLGLRTIARPVAALAHALDRTAKSDLSFPLPEAIGEDEIGSCWTAVAVFRDWRGDNARLNAERAAQSGSDDEQKRQAMMALAAEFEEAAGGIIAGVSRTSERLVRASEALMANATDTTEKSVRAAGAAEQTYTNVQSVASASEELSASFREIGMQISHAAKLISSTAAQIDNSDTEVQALSQSAQRVTAIVGIIRDIAEQTNLLALNATIEAARAGEAGRGFAVVASEVKALANQTAKATQDIEVHIGSIQQATERTVDSIQGIGAQVRELNEVATVIAGATEEQGTVSQEIARNVSEAATGTGEVSKNVVGVKEASDLTDDEAAHVLEFAQELSTQSSELRTHVDRLLASLRAA